MKNHSADDIVHKRWSDAAVPLAKTLSGYRKGRGLSRNELATRMDISVSALGKLEEGRYPAPHILHTIFRSKKMSDEERRQAGLVDAFHHVFNGPPPSSARELPRNDSRLHVQDFYQQYRVPLTEVACEYYRLLRTRSGLVPSGDLPALIWPELLGLLPIKNIDSRLRWNVKAPRSVKSMIDMVGLHNLRSPKLYNGLSYRFLGIGKEGSLEFCHGRYFEFLDSCEALAFEFAGAVFHNNVAHDIVVKQDFNRYNEVARILLKNHDALLPERRKTSANDFSQRHSAFGTCALVIIKRTNQAPDMVLNVRSEELTETPGLSHVIPAGTFQPNSPEDSFHDREFSLEENLIREFIEELVDDKQLRGDLGSATSFETMFSEKGRRFFDLVVSRRKYSMFYLGTIVDPLNLKPEVATVIMIHEAYLDQITDRILTKTWETGNFRLFPFSKENIEKIIKGHSFVPSGKAHLLLVLKHFETLEERLNDV